MGGVEKKKETETEIKPSTAPLVFRHAAASVCVCVWHAVRCQGKIYSRFGLGSVCELCVCDGSKQVCVAAVTAR